MVVNILSPVFNVIGTGMLSTLKKVSLEDLCFHLSLFFFFFVITCSLNSSFVSLTVCL